MTWLNRLFRSSQIDPQSILNQVADGSCSLNDAMTQLQPFLSDPGAAYYICESISSLSGSSYIGIRNLSLLKENLCNFDQITTENGSETVPNQPVV